MVKIQYWLRLILGGLPESCQTMFLMQQKLAWLSHVNSLGLIALVHALTLFTKSFGPRCTNWSTIIFLVTRISIIEWGACCWVATMGFSTWYCKQACGCRAHWREARRVLASYTDYIGLRTPHLHTEHPLLSGKEREISDVLQERSGGSNCICIARQRI